MTQAHRNSILLEQCEILSHESFAGDQYIITVHAPRISQRAQAGSFVHIQCDATLPLRRPLSIMLTHHAKGSMSLLYKAVGRGTQLLAKRKVGELLDVLGPIGQPFVIHPNKPRPLLIGGGVGMPPMIFVAHTLKQYHKNISPFIILGSEVPFPFTSKPSTIMLNGLPDGVIATMPLLEEWGFACRLSSLQAYPGCYDGYVTDLARHWLESLNQSQRNEVEIFSCGPTAMLQAVAQLAKHYQLPCQVSLEEYMACAVGGCAGCVVEVTTENGSSMQRVCVDGPVFDAAQVF